MAEKSKTNRMFQLQQYSIPLALVFILCVLVVPIPTALLDVLLAFNISISFVILFVTLYLERPLEFTSFPAILLVTTLFRLAMNVATTRLVLLHGDQGTAAAGHVVEAFGTFVVGGNYFVGAVIFLLISIVNLKVVTKGSGRIAEVAARFTLDAMPGKQMAIDSDLNTGIITESEAKIRRKELSQEAEFYGAMDGAAKFVAGDASAGVFITGINIIGGFLIGMIQHQMDWREAAATYSLLTIGDGLVSQIPTIIISTASGLIVARAASGADLGTEVFGQLIKSHQPLYIASGVSFGCAMVPGLPFFPFVTLSLFFLGIGILRSKAIESAKIKAILDLPKKDAEKGLPSPGSTEEVQKLLNLDTLELEVGYELVNLVEGGPGGDLIERIRSLRRQFALELGFVVPPIHIRDNVRLKSNQYRVMLRGTEIGTGTLKPHYHLAMDAGQVASPIQGIPTKEPAFGLDAIWIPDSEKERAQFAGYTVVDLSTVVTTHLTEIVRAHAHELLGRQETQALLDHLKKEAPKVVDELVPGLMSLGQVQQVLGLLLREQISVRDLRTILETLSDWAGTIKHPEKLAEQVRRRLARTISAKFISPEGVLSLASLNPSLERHLTECLQTNDEGSFLALEPTTAQVIINKLNRLAERFAEAGQTPILLVPGHIRPAMARFVERFAPGFAVISHYEVAAQTKVQSLGVVSIEELQKDPQRQELSRQQAA